MVRAILTGLVVLLVSMSGCMDLLGGNKTDDGDATPPAPSGPPDPVVTFEAAPDSGVKPVKTTFYLNFSSVLNRSIEWSLDLDADGTVDANGTRTTDGSESFVQTYKDAGIHNASATATMGGATLLSMTLSIDVSTDQTTQRMTSTREFEFESCSGPESYLQKGKVPFVGDETDVDPDDDDSEKIPSRIDFKATKATWHQVYQAEWSFNGSFLEVYAFFTNSDGVIQDHDTDAGSKAGGNLTLHGRIPDSTVWVVLYACGGPTAITVDYVTPRPGTE